MLPGTRPKSARSRALASCPVPVSSGETWAARAALVAIPREPPRFAHPVATPPRMLIWVSSSFGVADEMLGIKFNAEPDNQVELGFEVVNVPFLVLHAPRTDRASPGRSRSGSDLPHRHKAYVLSSRSRDRFQLPPLRCARCAGVRASACSACRRGK